MVHERLPNKSSRNKSRIAFSDAIFPFAEKPCYDDNIPTVENTEINVVKRIHATDLFSLFTADIIKEKTVFTR